MSLKLGVGGVDKVFQPEQVSKATLFWGGRLRQWRAPGEQDTNAQGMGFGVPLKDIVSDLSSRVVVDRDSVDDTELTQVVTSPVDLTEGTLKTRTFIGKFLKQRVSFY